MAETITGAPICKTVACKKPLTYMENSQCWRCLSCNPLGTNAPTVEPERKYVDVKVTEQRVREIVAEELTDERVRKIVVDELEDWHIQEPPVTRSEIVVNQPASGCHQDHSPSKTVEELNSKLKKEKNKIILRAFETKQHSDWRAEAKELGINTFQRKKADVLAEIEKLKRPATSGQ